MSVPSFPPRSEDTVKSVAAGIAGATEIKNIVTISQSDYDALSAPDAKTLYIITS
jgi:hypothetical protein